MVSLEINGRKYEVDVAPQCDYWPAGKIQVIISERRMKNEKEIFSGDGFAAIGRVRGSGRLRAAREDLWKGSSRDHSVICFQTNEAR